MAQGFAPSSKAFPFKIPRGGLPDPGRLLATFPTSSVLKKLYVNRKSYIVSRYPVFPTPFSSPTTRGPSRMSARTFT